MRHLRHLYTMATPGLATEDKYVRFSFKGRRCDTLFPEDSQSQKCIKWQVIYRQPSPNINGTCTLRICLASGASSAVVYLFANNRCIGMKEHSVFDVRLEVKRTEFVDTGLVYIKGSDERLKTTICLMIVSVTPFITTPLDSSLSDVLKKSKDVSEDLNDISLYFGSEKKLVQVSKFMLMVRSPVFVAMFRSDCEEAKSNKVEIPDIRPAVGEELISYMYTDKTPNMGTMTEELWHAADKYNLPGLKALCENELALQTNTSNAAHMLLFAHKFCGQGKLKEFVSSFIADDYDICCKVMQSDGWSEVEECLELAYSVTRKFFGLPQAKKARVHGDD